MYGSYHITLFAPCHHLIFVFKINVYYFCCTVIIILVRKTTSTLVNGICFNQFDSQIDQWYHKLNLAACETAILVVHKVLHMSIYVIVRAVHCS